MAISSYTTLTAGRINMQVCNSLADNNYYIYRTPNFDATQSFSINVDKSIIAYVIKIYGMQMCRLPRPTTVLIFIGLLVDRISF